MKITSRYVKLLSKVFSQLSHIGRNKSLFQLYKQNLCFRLNMVFLWVTMSVWSFWSMSFCKSSNKQQNSNHERQCRLPSLQVNKCYQSWADAGNHFQSNISLAYCHCCSDLSISLQSPERTCSKQHKRMNVLLSSGRQVDRCAANDAEQKRVQSVLFSEAEWHYCLLLIKETINKSNMFWL